MGNDIYTKTKNNINSSKTQQCFYDSFPYYLNGSISLHTQNIWWCWWWFLSHLFVSSSSFHLLLNLHVKRGTTFFLCTYIETVFYIFNDDISFSLYGDYLLMMSKDFLKKFSLLKQLHSMTSLLDVPHLSMTWICINSFFYSV